MNCNTTHYRANSSSVPGDPTDKFPGLSILTSGEAIAEAQAAGLRLTAVAAATDETAARALAKRRHDVKGAVRTLGFSVAALKAGYKFDDDKAQAKIDAIAKAVAVLEKESELLLAVAYRE